MTKSPYGLTNDRLVVIEIGVLRAAKEKTDPVTVI